MEVFDIKTYISHQEKQACGRKMDKSHYTVIGTNTASTFKMYSFLIHKAKKPHAFRNL